MLPIPQTLRVSIWQELHSAYDYLRRVFGAESRKGEQTGEICVMRGVVMICAVYGIL
jgi:hypothetical protein